MKFGDGGIFETFLEGSVDRIIYWDYRANRGSFNYCSLPSPSTSGVPKITAMLCQTKHVHIVFHPLSGLKQSTNKETGVS